MIGDTSGRRIAVTEAFLVRHISHQNWCGVFEDDVELSCAAIALEVFDNFDIKIGNKFRRLLGAMADVAERREITFIADDPQCARALSWRRRRAPIGPADRALVEQVGHTAIEFGYVLSILAQREQATLDAVIALADELTTGKPTRKRKRSSRPEPQQ